MNWHQAVNMARKGHSLRRVSDKRMVWLHSDELPVYDCGTEGFRLMSAWTPDDRPTMIFTGTESKCLFIPGDSDRAATDWEIEK